MGSPGREQYTAWLIGVILAISANIISNLGLNFQKRAHSRREAKSKASADPKTKSSNQKAIPQSLEYARQESVSLDELDSPPSKQPLPSSPTEHSTPKPTPTASQSTKKGSYVCDSFWLLGLCLQILGALLDFAALGYAPQSVVAPLGSLTLVVNVVVSPCMHSEKPTYRTIIATMVIILGAAMTVAASPREDGVSTVDGVFALYEASSFLIYSTVIGG